MCRPMHQFQPPVAAAAIGRVNTPAPRGRRPLVNATSSAPLVAADASRAKQHFANPIGRVVFPAAAGCSGTGQSTATRGGTPPAHSRTSEVMNQHAG